MHFHPISFVRRPLMLELLSAHIRLAVLLTGNTVKRGSMDRHEDVSARVAMRKTAQGGKSIDRDIKTHYCLPRSHHM